MKIRKLDTSTSSDVKHFINFPFTLYKDCKQWVPPLVSSVKAIMDKQRHPFYRHSHGDFFVAESGDEIVGQIAVFDKRDYNDYKHTNIAAFYYFDAIDDIEVAQALFQAAANWAVDHNLDTLIGPWGFQRSNGWGLLVEGYEYRTAPGIPYNHPYYERLVKSAGLEKVHDYISGYVEGDYKLPERFYTIAERVKERRGYWIKSFRSKRELRSWIPRIQDINNRSFTNVWGYYPITTEEAQTIGQQLLTLADPKLIKVVMKENTIIGFAFIFPDVSRGLQKARGKLWPFGWVHLLYDIRHTEHLSANGLGILPQHQGIGANIVLYTELMHILNERKVTHCDVAQVSEANIKSLGDMERLGVWWYKRHRVYKKDLTAYPHKGKVHTANLESLSDGLAILHRTGSLARNDNK